LNATMTTIDGSERINIPPKMTPEEKAQNDRLVHAFENANYKKYIFR